MIHLDDLYRQLLEKGQRGVACAEISKGKAHTEFTKSIDGFTDQLQIGQGAALQYLQLDT